MTIVEYICERARVCLDGAEEVKVREVADGDNIGGEGPIEVL